jgi:hypothetical protein
MESYKFYKKTNKGRQYLQDDNTFNASEKTAKVFVVGDTQPKYKGQFWIELIRLLAELILKFGITLKRQKV